MDQICYCSDTLCRHSSIKFLLVWVNSDILCYWDKAWVGWLRHNESLDPFELWVFLISHQLQQHCLASRHDRSCLTESLQQCRTDKGWSKEMDTTPTLHWPYYGANINFRCTWVHLTLCNIIIDYMNWVAELNFVINLIYNSLWIGSDQHFEKIFIFYFCIKIPS